MTFICNTDKMVAEVILMDAMKYREMYLELRREVEEAISQLDRVLWETDKKLLDLNTESQQESIKIK